VDFGLIMVAEPIFLTFFSWVLTDLVPYTILCTWVAHLGGTCLRLRRKHDGFVLGRAGGSAKNNESVGNEEAFLMGSSFFGDFVKCTVAVCVFCGVGVA